MVEVILCLYLTVLSSFEYKKRMPKVISNQISPNLNLSDFWTGLKSIFNKKNINFTKYFNSKNYLLTNAARSGITEIIKTLNLPKEKRTVGIPAFTCAVTASPFLTKDYKIIWLDTDKNGLLDPNDLAQKADQISVLLAPHIFGQKLDLEKIQKICTEKNIFLIEDCAHRFDKKNNNADVKLLSFGREKVFSCVSGGAITWADNSPFKNKFEKIKLPPAKLNWTLRHLLQIFVLSIALPTWNFGGKIWAAVWSKSKFLPRAVTPGEKQGFEDFPISQLPTAQQAILLSQFKKENKIFVHKKEIANLWKNTCAKLFPEAEIIIPNNYFRVILKFPNQKSRDEILKKATKYGFLIREWDGEPIAPNGTNLAKFGYTKGTCPNAEHFAQTYLTLPTNMRVKPEDVKRFEKVFS